MSTPTRLWKLLDVKESTRLDERGNFIPIRIVPFMVGNHGPFQITLDAKDFSAAHVAVLLDKHAAEIKALEGS